MKVDRELTWAILRAQSGDKEAFDYVLQAIQDSLFRYIRNLTQNGTLAEDILQEVFLLIYRKLRWLETPALFHSWVYKVATREAWKHLKREKKWAAVDDSLQMEAPGYELDLKTISEQLPKLLAEISPASRSVLVLHFLNEMKLSEVAEVLDISIGTVKSRLAYGLATLRRTLNAPPVKTT